MADTQNTSSTLYQTLWNSADILRSKMDANEYKNYLLGLIFYKYLSDQVLYKSADLLEEASDDLKEAQATYNTAWEDAETQADLVDELKNDLAFVIEPQLTFSSLVDNINDGTFQLEDLKQGFTNVEKSAEIFNGLFADVDLYSNKLGATPQKQNATIAAVMKELSTLDFGEHAGDVLGDAYEYLISQFASESGKKAGEFYTPQAVSELMTRIMIQGKEDQKGLSLYDPTCGSGSLLLNAKKYSHEPNSINYFGQELNTSTYNLARMNMMLHGVDAANQHLSNGDTLDVDWPSEEPTNFDGVMMNPPYSAKWGAEKGFLEDPRFSSFGVLAPKSKADFAFLLHGYYHLKDTGVMAIVLPHGVLFRGNAEGKIREKLLEMGAIDTVIGLPSNLFFSTSIPTTVIILKKNRTNKDVLFIDASNDFEKQKTQNILNEDNIQKILTAYNQREDVEKYAHVASYDEIKENDFNLNIPRYVDTFEEEPEIDLKELNADMAANSAALAANQAELAGMLKELTSDDAEVVSEIAKFIEMLEGGVKHD
ncbi:type I restriction-modification system subunit M [Periweissella fabaria]|uniref:site-specific DNA-methyltransferase (adenine-specific) n=1 Tax=Periweissella fabaria TaxID=546157 RepID=A0ABM8Z3N9_9LACO|nr:type I restriction-modification system subunit M [Periweissella fabaria]MCM0596393.1 type I restriction-modification system subunit M [Periweissella fabaria]CAH0415879.1 hypothetical protein WFA24289_00177 [Periweissella fabaria]